MITHFLNPEIRGQGHITNTWPTMFGSRLAQGARIKGVCSFASNWFHHLYYSAPGHSAYILLVILLRPLSFTGFLWLSAVTRL